jgi:uncharacterized membrane protein YbhN (UPF0104 family)
VTGAPSRAVWYTAGAVLAAGLLYYSLRGIDWRQVGATLRHASPAPLLMASGIATTTLFLRAYRWRILLSAGGEVGIPIAFWATAAGYFGNNFLPARAGELIRTFIVSSRTRLEGAFVLATALSERVADAVALVIITAIVLLVVPAPPGWLSNAARPIAFIGVVGAACIALLPLLAGPSRRLLLWIPAPDAVRTRLVAASEHALRGIRAFHELPRLGGFVGVTIVVWYLDALGSVLAAGALGLNMPLSVAFLLIAGLSVGSALPSTPGYVGIYQFVAVSVLTPFGFSRTDAIAFILVAQAMMYVVIGFWGALGLLRYRRAV